MIYGLPREGHPIEAPRKGGTTPRKGNITAEPLAGDGVWREDSAIWEIVAGELVARRPEHASDADLSLVAKAGEMAARAGEMVREGDLDSAGHALIGCAVSLGAVALRSETATQTHVENFAAELAASVSWDAGKPTPEDLAELSAKIGGATQPGREGPTLWELAVRAGAAAAGLSPYIVRRRERRDLQP